MFLDARRNRYLCIAGSAGRCVQALLSGCDAVPDEDAALEELFEARLLTPSDASWTLKPIAAAAVTALSQEPERATRLAGRQLLLFARTYLSTLLKLHLRPPHSWWGKESRSESDTILTPEETLHLAGMARAAMVFLPRASRCLPNSLLLVDFVRRCGGKADIVFGVRTYPFSAHCWAEADGTILNDTLEHTSWFTPIARF